MQSSDTTTAGERARMTDRLLDAAGLSVDRLPMLPVLFDRMSRTFADTLRQKSTSPSYLSVSDIDNERIGDVLDANESNAMVAVFHVPEWDSRILIGIDRDFVYTMVEVLFGADGTEPPLDEERPFSNIETRIARSTFIDAAKALKDSFEPIADIELKLERVETRMDFAVIGRRNNPAMVARLLLQALGRGGEMFIIMPHSVLNPLRQSLSQVLTGEMSSRDRQWTHHFQSEIQRTKVKLNAILEEREMTLGELTQLKVGQVIELNATANSRVKLACKDENLFDCTIGQMDGAYTVRIEDFILKEEDILDDILSH